MGGYEDRRRFECRFVSSIHDGTNMHKTCVPRLVKDCWETTLALLAKYASTKHQDVDLQKILRKYVLGAIVGFLEIVRLESLSSFSACQRVSQKNGNRGTPADVLIPAPVKTTIFLYRPSMIWSNNSSSDNGGSRFGNRFLLLHSSCPPPS